MKFSSKLKMVLFMMLIFVAVADTVCANEVPAFMNGDKNYPLVWKDSQAAHYLDRSSINVTVNDEPFFIITARTVTADGIETHKFFFDESTPDMRVFDTVAGDWRYLNPCEGLTCPVYVGEAVFYFALGRKFYGNYFWKEEIDGKIRYTDDFPDVLYQGWS